MDTISAHEQRIIKGAANAKIKMPYKMFLGMQKKTIEKLKKRETVNKELDILAESGGFRKQRLMEEVFAQREEDKKKAKQYAKRGRQIKFERIMRKERGKKRELIRSIEKKKAEGENSGKGKKFMKKGHSQNMISKFH